MLITHARIHTMADAGIIEDGFILTKGSKIEAVGNMNDCSNCDGSTEIIDLKGMALCPGFIDAHTHMGMLGIEQDANELNEPITPSIRALDAVNPRDQCFKNALSFGITSVMVSPGSANPIAGQIVAIKTFGERIDDMIIKSPVAIKFALGENPKKNYAKKQKFPGTRMSTAAIIREKLMEAKLYLEDKKFATANFENCDPPKYSAKKEALIPLLEREIPAHIHAHRADDIFTAIRIAKEFSLEYTIVHGTQAHLIASEFTKSDHVSLLAGPFLSGCCKQEMEGLSAKMPQALLDSDINVAIITDHPVTSIEYLPICAAVAVREGLPASEALKAITINPAKICRLDDRIGSIEKGKDADFIVFEGMDINFLAKPKFVFCNGVNIVK